MIVVNYVRKTKMAYKFSITIDYPDGKTHDQYLVWFEEKIGSPTFTKLLDRLVDEEELVTSDNRKTTRIDDGCRVVQTNYYRYENHASAMHYDLTMLLQSFDEYLVISDIETITEVEYNSTKSQMNY
jgi:hypothetical protein